MKSFIINAVKNKTARGIVARGIIVSFLGMFVMACSGCGGGGGGSSPAPVAQAQPKPVQISAFGDSTMAGLQMINGQYVITHVVTADLQADLQAQLGNTVTVITDAQQGTTLNDLLTGADGFQTFATYMQTDKSAIVLENFGINDRGQYSGANFQQYLTQFITLAQSAGKTVVLEEPNPVCLKGTTDQEQVFADGQTIQEFVTIIDSTAQQYGLPLVKQYDQIKAMPNWCTLMSDGWAHPTAALYAIKAQNEAAVLAPLISDAQK